MYWKPRQDISMIGEIWKDHGGSARGAVVCGSLAGALTMSAVGAALIEAVDPEGVVLKDKSGRPMARAREVHGPVLGSAVGVGIRVGVALLLVPMVAWVFVFPRRGYPKIR